MDTINNDVQSSVTRLSTPEEFLGNEDIVRINSFIFHMGGSATFNIGRDVLSEGIKIDIQDNAPVEMEEYTIPDIDQEIARLDKLLKRQAFKKDKMERLGLLLKKLRSLANTQNWDGNENAREIKITGKKTLLGQFCPATRTVILYRDTLGDNWDLIVSTYVHEIFHAYYFLRNGHNSSVREIEEPIVEFSMLTFLKACCKGRFFAPAYKAVCDKQDSGYLAAYGFGVYIYDSIANKGELMARYSSSRPTLYDTSPLMQGYITALNQIYPFDREAKVLNDLCRILNFKPECMPCTSQCFSCYVFGCDSLSDDVKSARLYAVVRYFVRKVFWLVWSPYSLNAEQQIKNIEAVIEDSNCSEVNLNHIDSQEKTIYNSTSPKNVWNSCRVSELLGRLCRCLPVMIGGPVSKVDNPSILQGNDDKENTIKFIALGKYVETLPKFYFPKVDTAAELMRQILSGELSFLKYYTIGDRTLEEIAADFLEINHLEKTAPRALYQQRSEAAKEYNNLF